MSDIATRFARDTADHQMTVVHDVGLYRHLQFRSVYWRPPLLKPQTTSMGWFDLITAPGMLLFQGDGDSFQFRRIEDMFKFFRGRRTNPHYWAEKLVTPGREDAVMKYDREIFEAEVKREFVDAVRDRRAPAGLGRAVRRDLLDSDEAWSEEGAHRLLSEFSFYQDEKDRYGRSKWVDGELTWIEAKAPDFQFYDTWEWRLRDYDWWFLWSLHAIVWGIAQYDASRGEEIATGTAPSGRAMVTASPAGDVL